MEWSWSWGKRMKRRGEIEKEKKFMKVFET